VPHLAGELLNHIAGLQMLHIPYKRGAPASVGMLGGEVQMYIDTATGSAEARLSVICAEARYKR
jgi:tripartite-type tricarboxylate transporter receptor subunit TctC